MTKKEFIEGGILILGAAFIAMSVIYWGQLLVCWLDAQLVNRFEESTTRYAAGFVRQIAPQIVQPLVGIGLILKNRDIARMLDNIGSK